MLKSPAFSTSFLESRMIQKLKSRKSRIKPGLFAFLLAERIIFGKKTHKKSRLNTGFRRFFFLSVTHFLTHFCISAAFRGRFCFLGNSIGHCAPAHKPPRSFATPPPKQKAIPLPLARGIATDRRDPAERPPHSRDIRRLRYSEGRQPTYFLNCREK